MLYKSVYKILLAAILFPACNGNDQAFDATGTFEADEVVVSAELGGRITSLDVEEGNTISKGKLVGEIDAENLELQKEQVEASINTLNQKTNDVRPQVQLLRDQLAVQQSQLTNLLHEKDRFENLYRQDAATGKQVDDIHAQIDILQKQMAVTRQQIQVQKENIATQNRSILSEGKPLEKRVDQLKEQLEKASIINPVQGTVITKFAEAGEVTAPGKALYTVADLSHMTLRAYITGDQFSQVKLGQPVKVLVDEGSGKYRELPGTITWISDQAEFTPKTIQTKDERANLVYAIKINVKNDGYLKMGMYGEVQFKDSTSRNDN